MGVILYEAIAGERPFTGSTTATAAAIVADEPPLLRTRVPDLPEGLEAAVSKALAKKAEDRFADVRAFAEALAPFASSRDELRAIEAAAGGGGGGTLRPPVKKQSSTPSFVHATTLAQTTPPPVPGSMRSPLAATAPPIASSAQKSVARSGEPPAPSTEAAWATQRTTSGRAGRATLVAVGLAAGAVAVFVFVKVRGMSGATPAAVPSVATSFSAPPALTAPSPPVVAASTSLPTSPPSSTPTPVVVAGPPPETSSPHHAQPKPHPAPAHPISSASAAPPPLPAPAATNPLHL
jgi:serine/threonine-protein kinase